MDGVNVNPKAWTFIKHVYDDGEVSGCIGHYRGEGNLSYAIRWNFSNGDRSSGGFPVVCGHPVWFKIPDYFVSAILRTMIARVKDNPEYGDLEMLEEALDGYRRQREIVQSGADEVANYFKQADEGGELMFNPFV